jgi:hypothetical protein
VIFAEPVIITACEFLEQNASSSSQAVSLVGYVLFLTVCSYISFYILTIEDLEVVISTIRSLVEMHGPILCSCDLY